MEHGKKHVIALGFFDGVHLGHQALLRRAVERAEEQGMTPAVFTFDRAPKEFVTGVPVPLITTPEERCALVRRLFPIQRVIIAPFNREMMTRPWQAYLDMLEQTYDAGWLVAGNDYRFGYKNEGDADCLRLEAEKRGLGCDIVPEVAVDGVRASSTHIRALLEQGRREEAEHFLGYPLPLLEELRIGLAAEKE